jgi:hypothetical protein
MMFEQYFMLQSPDIRFAASFMGKILARQGAAC